MDHDKTVSIAFIVELLVSIIVAIIAFAEMITFWGHFTVGRGMSVAAMISW